MQKKVLKVRFKGFKFNPLLNDDGSFVFDSSSHKVKGTWEEKERTCTISFAQGIVATDLIPDSETGKITEEALERITDCAMGLIFTLADLGSITPVQKTDFSQGGNTCHSIFYDALEGATTHLTTVDSIYWETTDLIPVTGYTPEP